MHRLQLKGELGLSEGSLENAGRSWPWMFLQNISRATRYSQGGMRSPKLMLSIIKIICSGAVQTKCNRRVDSVSWELPTGFENEELVPDCS